MRTSNPVLGGDAFTDAAYAADTRNVMTVQGTALKTGALVILAVVSAAISWSMLESGHPATMGVLIGGAVGGLVLALVTCFNPRWAAVTAPLYAIAEGLFLGVLSAMYNHAFDGMADPFPVARYHSLVVRDLPDSLRPFLRKSQTPR